MNFDAVPSGQDASGYLELISKGAAIRRHVELLGWLRGDLQKHLPHDILIAGWGNFRDGCIQHDIVSELPGVRSYSLGTDSLPFLMGKFHECWVAAQRQPCRLNFFEFEYFLGKTSLPGSFCAALRSMRSVLIHGLRDERSRQECLYVMFSAQDIPAEPASKAIKVLLPSIDNSLRQLALLPQQRSPAMPSGRSTQEDSSVLSERETQIMAWVAMGKTNSEIGSILSISGFTVKNHMQRIFQKLNVFNRAQAVSKVTRVTLDG
jgi:transcriptional regulator EpsA